jgi:hypothetical protein
MVEGRYDKETDHEEKRREEPASHCKNEEVDVRETVGVRFGELSLSSGLTGSLRSAD